MFSEDEMRLRVLGWFRDLDFLWAYPRSNRYGAAFWI